MRIFYESLSKQIPSSEMAEFWFVLFVLPSCVGSLLSLTKAAFLNLLFLVNSQILFHLVILLVLLKSRIGFWFTFLVLFVDIMFLVVCNKMETVDLLFSHYDVATSL